MLFSSRFHDGIRAGTITMTVRAWKRAQVKPGRRYRTAAGVVEVDAVERVPLRAVTDDDARRCGFPSRGELVEHLGVDDGKSVFVVAFHFTGEDDRVALREQADLTPDEVVALAARLDRLDRASRRGPWTAEVLALIAAHPATRAADLAASMGRETLPFKADVRKLKAMGLTESLEVGYRLSARGRAYVAAAGPCRQG